jgi:hypothetical protein
MSQVIPIYIPTYISSVDYQPARVLPRLLFYNGQIDCEKFYVKNENNSSTPVNQFPYFDNYNVVTGSFPTTNSDSLLFYNEQPAYGQTPIDSLYTKYWETYVELLYNPRTRLLNASAIIPLADYFNMELNDIVSFRSNYYHLRAINEYNLKNGECQIQLLGPILPDSLNLPERLFPKCLGYDESDCTLACFYSCECTNTCPEPEFSFSSVDDSDFSFDIEVTGSYQLQLPISNTAGGGVNDGAYYKTLFTASWGDGSTSIISGSEDLSNATHTFSPGTYTITLSGMCSNLGNPTVTDAMRSFRTVITKVNKWGSMNFGRLSFQGASNLSSIPDGEPGLYSVLTFPSAFGAASGVFAPDIIIPNNLFKYCHNAGNNYQAYSEVFRGNRIITQIPERLFYYSPNADFFNSAFIGCNIVTSLPNQMFAPLPNASSITDQFVNIGSMFRNMLSLQSIPQNILDPISGSVGSFATNVFSMSTTGNALTGNAPAIWNSPSASSWTSTDFFNNCINLSNYASIPAGWK